MSRKPRMTGFGRMLIILIIAAPFAYIGASYYNGEDGIQNLKNLLGLGEKKESTEPSAIDGNIEINTISKEEWQKLVDDLRYSERRIKELQQENDSLRDQLKKANEALEQFRKQ